MAIKNQDYIKNLIRELISLPSETEWVEFKHNNDDPQMIGEYISALGSSATLLGRPKAYMLCGIDDETHKKETDEPKTILVNYLPNSTKIPPLAKSLLGCWIGDEVPFQGKIYIIEAIQK